MSISNKLIGITPTAGGVEPVGIDFDGTNDYLSRTSDLVGNADSKTFTFSAWVYNGGDTLSQLQYLYLIDNGSGQNRFYITNDSNGKLTVLGRNSNNNNILVGQITGSLSLPYNTWIHILVSVDLANPSSRAIYINDTSQTVSWSTYTDQAIDFTNPEHYIATEDDLTNKLDGRLAGVYLDYTYRDLSVEANRRDFIDADGRYVTPPTSGIISVPMDDPEDPGRNDGTGGDFTLNGTIAQAGRGPNQYNAPASTFDGSADYLDISGLSFNSKTFTTSFTAKPNSALGTLTVFRANSSGNEAVKAELVSGEFRYRVRNGSGVVASADTPVTSQNKYVNVSISFDVSDSNKRHVFIDGVDLTSSTTWSFYTDALSYTVDTMAIGANTNGAGAFNADIGDFWFDTTYIDLSADNPFYDSETGKPKDLGADGSNPTGSAPLIYLPLRADDAGSNKGTGGDFTVNSGPFVGARGPSEFWGESAEFNGSNQYLSRSSALTGASDGKQVTLACSVYWDANTLDSIFTMADSDGDVVFRLYARPDGDQCVIDGRDATASLIFEADFTLSSGASQWLNFLVSFDLTDSAKRHLYVDGANVSPSWNTYSNTDILFSSAQNVYLAANRTGSVDFDGKIGFLWFNTEYIDFSQEANRLKFFDAFGYPVDLGEDGSLPTGNQPLIYMNNDFHLGTNLGSGGDFTPQNTPTDGGFVRG